MTTRVLIADDHRIVREGLSSLLAREPGLEVVGQAEDGHVALRQVRSLAPDLLITDVSMPGLNGIEAIRRLRACSPAVQVICLSMHGDSRTVMAALDAGAAGYVLKDASFEELALAIRRVMAAEVYLSASLVGVVVNEARQRQARATLPTPVPELTTREREVVQLLSEGWSTGRIAERLHVSVKTVATHRENAQLKLGVSGVAGLVRHALREGLSSLEAACG
jgi:DNA-binding NarL/FixJ family response regulator